MPFLRRLLPALAAASFYDSVSSEQIDKYKSALRFFQNLRSAVRQRYAGDCRFPRSMSQE